ncbi:hypothetical protein SprV_0100381700 [Sparganum proliferum]
MGRHPKPRHLLSSPSAPSLPAMRTQCIPVLIAIARSPHTSAWSVTCESIAQGLADQCLESPHTLAASTSAVRTAPHFHSRMGLLDLMRIYYSGIRRSIDTPSTPRTSIMPSPVNNAALRALTTSISTTTTIANETAFDSPDLSSLHCPRLCSIQQRRRDDCFVRLEFAARMETVTIPNGALQATEGLVGLGNLADHLFVDFCVAREGAAQMGEGVDSLQLGAVNVELGRIVGSVGWRMVLNHRSPRVDD